MKVNAVMLEKINRITAWITAILVLVYMITGFGMVGMWGMGKLLGMARSSYWHSNVYLAYLLIITLAIHGGICLYRTLKRNRVI